jgi:hypothetical protein
MPRAEDRVSHSLYRIGKIASFTSYALGHEGLREGVERNGFAVGGGGIA